MKFKKYNLKHWFYYAVSMWNLIFGIILSIFLKRKTEKRIILFGHKFNGNLKAFFDYFKNVDDSKNFEIYFLTIDFQYHNLLKKERQRNILCTKNLADVLRIINSSVFICDHGINIFRILQIFKKEIKFIDVWHGIPFKGYSARDFKVLKNFDAIFTSSDYLKEIYVNKWGFKNYQVKVTGYARTDPFLVGKLNKNEILARYEVDDEYKSIVLVAPTWRHDNVKEIIFPPCVNTDVFFEKLNNIGKINDILFIFRVHLNTDFKYKKRYNNIRFFSMEDYPLTCDFLFISDILITDWSSIAIDYLVLNRPIIFLDIPPFFKNGFTLKPKDRVGYLVKDFNELEDVLGFVISHAEDYKNKFKQLRERVIKKAYGETLDGKSSERYLKEIKLLTK